MAVAPALLFKYSLEPTLRELSKEKLLQSLVVNMDLLEYTGYTMTDDDEFICDMKPEICEQSYQLDNLNNSPSIDLTKSDPA